MIFLTGLKRPNTVKDVDGGTAHKPRTGFTVAFFPCNNKFRHANIRRLDKGKVFYPYAVEHLG